MKLFSGLRTLSFLRRIARALEEANDLARERMSLEFEDYARKQKARGKKPRQLEISHPTVEQWNERWRQGHE